MKFVISRQMFVKNSNIKFNQNPSCGSRDVPNGRTDEQTDMMKLIVAFRNFAKGLKNENKIVFKDVFLTAQ
jgi:hypothetical protein